MAPEPLAQRWQRLPGLERLPEAGAAALTFDDGPDSDATAAVLDALDAIDARATFFVIGEQLVRHPGIAREAAARGHELALHGFAHLDHSAVSADEAREDLERGLWAFETILGSQPRRFRPPYGTISEDTHAACDELGLDVVYWSADPRDWALESAGEIAAGVEARLAAGAIVLLHDSARYAERPSAQPTARALARIGEAAAARGLRLGSVDELAA